MKKESLNEITLQTIKEGIFEAYKPGITSIAPLGQSGPTIILYEEKKIGESGRVSQVSLRNYCGDVELLITNKNGGFLFYGRYDCRMGLEFIAQEYFRIFENCKALIKMESKSRPNFSNVEISENASKTIGFQMMNMVGFNL
jgi:hypothetical protein